VNLVDLKNDLADILGRDNAIVRARLGGVVCYEVEGVEVDDLGNIYIAVKLAGAWPAEPEPALLS